MARKKDVLSVTLQPELVAWLQKEAEANYRPVSSQVGMMLEMARAAMIESAAIRDGRTQVDVDALRSVK